MQFTIHKPKPFLDALRRVAKVSPIINLCVRDGVTGAHVQVGGITVSTDLSGYASSFTGGTVTVAAKPVIAAIRAAKRGDVNVKFDVDALTITGADGSVATVPAGAAPHVAPTLPTGGAFTMWWADAAPARMVRDWVTLAVGTRPQLEGVRLEPSAVVATDGHRLHWLNAPWTGGPVRPITVPPILFDALPDGPVMFGCVETHVTATAGDTSITVPLMEGAFPDWRQVLVSTRTPAATVHVDAGTLVTVAARHAKAKGLTTRCECADGALHLSTEGKDAKVSDTVPHAGMADAATKWAMSARYLADALGMADGERVTVRVIDRWAPIEVTCGNAQALIMPMRD